MEIEAIIDIVCISITTLCIILLTVISLIREKKQLNLIDVMLQDLENNIDKVKVNTNVDAENNQTDYSNMNVINLKKIAQKKRIKGYYRMKKDELVRVLEGK